MPSNWSCSSDTRSSVCWDGWNTGAFGLGSLDEMDGLGIVGGVSFGGDVNPPAAGGGMDLRSVITFLRLSRLVVLGADPVDALAFGPRPPRFTVGAVMVAGDFVRRFPVCWFVADPPDDDGGVGCFAPPALDCLLFDWSPAPGRVPCELDFLRLAPGPPPLAGAFVVAPVAGTGGVSSFLTLGRRGLDAAEFVRGFGLLPSAGLDWAVGLVLVAFGVDPDEDDAGGVGVGFELCSGVAMVLLRAVACGRGSEQGSMRSRSADGRPRERAHTSAARDWRATRQ